MLGRSLRNGRALPERLRRGSCPICQHQTLFVRTGAWLRDNYFCISCLSVPRYRALIQVLQQSFPNWRALKIYESASSGAASEKLRREAAGYVGSQYYPNVPSGRMYRGFRSENLQRLSFPDDSFDLVVTQDVFEHVMEPASGFTEIERVLRPGGAHVFTVPLYPRPRTVKRAHLAGKVIVHDLPPDYHENPVDQSGSLVVHEWGHDLPDQIAAWTSLETEIIRLHAPQWGVVGEFTEVVISRKRG